MKLGFLVAMPKVYAGRSRVQVLGELNRPLRVQLERSKPMCLFVNLEEPVREGVAPNQREIFYVRDGDLSTVRD